MDTIDRFRGALVGLAAGEVIGLALEQAGDPLHTPIPLDPPLRWNGGTDLALRLARAILLAEEDESLPLETALRAAFVEWSTHPDARMRGMDPSTRAAADGLAHGAADPAHPHAQPAVLALRSVAFGLAFEPEDTFGPVRIACRLTHRDPTGAEAAALTAWLISSLVRGAPLDRRLVNEGREAVADVGLGGAVSDAIGDALALHAARSSRELQWLPSEAITPGDGGKRAESALGLAIVAALLTPPDSFLAGVELAARVHGHPSAVAGLAGALLGAARGMSAIPAAIVESLDELDVLLGVADSLRVASGIPGESPTPAPAVRRLWTPSPLEVVLQDWQLEPAVPQPEAEAPVEAKKKPEEPKFVEEGVEVDPKSLMEAWARRHG